MLDVDVVVVGAGPAGTVAARGLAREGFRVVILEEHREVGRPLHCSGLVTPRTLKAAGLDEGLVLNQVQGAEIYAPNAGPLILGDQRRRALVIDRIGFDRVLAQQAVEAGAELRLGHRVKEVRRHRKGVVTAVVRNRCRGEVNARLVIGADGWRSKVATCLRPQTGELIWCFGAEAYLPDHPRDYVRVYVGETLAPGWFAWSIPVEGKRVRLGIGTTVGPKSPKPRHLFNALRDQFPSHFRGLEVLGYSGGFIPLYHPVPIHGDSMLLVGDAARQVKPTSGGGIYSAIIAAKAAVTTATKALQEADTSADALASYAQQWRKELGREFERCAELRAMYLRLRPQQFADLLRLFSLPPLRAVVNRYGDIDYPSAIVAPSIKVATTLLAPALHFSNAFRRRWPFWRIAFPETGGLLSGAEQGD